MFTHARGTLTPFWRAIAALYITGRRERTSEKLDPYDSIVAEREGTRLSTVSILIRVTFGLGLLVWLVTWYWCYLRPTSAVCPVLEDVEAAVRKSVNGLF